MYVQSGRRRGGVSDLELLQGLTAGLAHGGAITNPHTELTRHTRTRGTRMLQLHEGGPPQHQDHIGHALQLYEGGPPQHQDHIGHALQLYGGVAPPEEQDLVKHALQL